MRAAREAGVPVVPQGGNTGLCAGGVPGAPGAIVLSTERLDRILSIDPDGPTATVEAGVVLGSLHERAAEHGLVFPLHLGAEGSARIGGLISTNAGGSHAARHGMMADRVLGLEVVLPDGRVWDGLRAVGKDNAGYALRRLFCGAEGTLGVVTRATLALAPAPRARATALLACPDLEAAARVGHALRRSLGELVDALEFFSDAGLGWALEHVEGLVWPLDERPPAIVLVELACVADGIDLDAMLEGALGEALERGDVTDGAVAASETQRAAFWRLREEIPEGQRREGAQLKQPPLGAALRPLRHLAVAFLRTVGAQHLAGERRADQAAEVALETLVQEPELGRPRLVGVEPGLLERERELAVRRLVAEPALQRVAVVQHRAGEPGRLQCQRGALAGGAGGATLVARGTGEQRAEHEPERVDPERAERRQRPRIDGRVDARERAQTADVDAEQRRHEEDEPDRGPADSPSRKPLWVARGHHSSAATPGSSWATATKEISPRLASPASTPRSSPTAT